MLNVILPYYTIDESLLYIIKSTLYRIIMTIAFDIIVMGSTGVSSVVEHGCGTDPSATGRAGGRRGYPSTTLVAISPVIIMTVLDSLPSSPIAQILYFNNLT
jgi:hypothetical protein